MRVVRLFVQQDLGAGVEVVLSCGQGHYVSDGHEGERRGAGGDF